MPQEDAVVLAEDAPERRLAFLRQRVRISVDEHALDRRARGDAGACRRELPEDPYVDEGGTLQHQLHRLCHHLVARAAIVVKACRGRRGDRRRGRQQWRASSGRLSRVF